MGPWEKEEEEEKKSIPQKLLPLQQSPVAHFLFTIGPQVSPPCAILGALTGRGGLAMPSRQFPKPGWQPVPQYMASSWICILGAGGVS